MLNSKPLQKLLFVDVETIPQYKSFYDMSPLLQELFLKRFKKEAEEMIGLIMDEWNVLALNTPEWHPKLEKFYNNRAPVCPEFLKIVCISVGFINNKDLPDDVITPIPADKELVFEARSFYGHDEVKILRDFYEATKSVLDKVINPSFHLVGYNYLMFDGPVLAKRFIVNKLKLPAMLDTDGKKEWNLPYIIDPRNSWKMTSFDGGVSLALLCETLGVPSPKEDISGKEVRDVYYVQNDVERIAKYCTLDIYRLCECYLRMKSMPNILILK